MNFVPFGTMRYSIFDIDVISITCTNVTWSGGLSGMLIILILSYRVKKVTNSYLHCLGASKNYMYIAAARCPIEMRFGSKCSILNGQVIYIEKKYNLNIFDMWLISRDHVTNMQVVLAKILRDPPGDTGIHVPIHVTGYWSPNVNR